MTRLSGPVRLVGRACRVRWAILDNPLRFGGHDKRASPQSGLACAFEPCRLTFFFGSVKPGAAGRMTDQN